MKYFKIKKIIIALDKISLTQNTNQFHFLAHSSLQGYAHDFLLSQCNFLPLVGNEPNKVLTYLGLDKDKHFLL